MTLLSMSFDAAWDAFVARDRDADGVFLVGVETTGIYCKPSCPARRPRREHVRFFADATDARAAGFRACMRCTPDAVARDQVAIARAVAIIDAADTRITLDDLAAQVGYAPHHFSRLFKHATGVTPAAFARSRQAQRIAGALGAEASITDAVYAAGYSAPSRFYDAARDRLGMTPSVWRRGGAGVVVRWTIASTRLGPLLVAATEIGLCRVAFDEDGASLLARFPKAEIRADDAALAALAARVVAEVEAPGRNLSLPLDIQGTAFQEAVWQKLREIPVGETRSYGELAASLGRPGAVRATGSACGANPVAVIVPCHRVQRADGNLGGYAWGLDRKRALRACEQAILADEAND